MSYFKNIKQDVVADAGTLLWSSGALNAKTEGAPVSIDMFGVPLNTGLTLEVSVASADVLVVYE